MNEPGKTRRDLLKAAAPAAFTILRPELVRGSAANSAVRVGLIGCGRRGSTDATNIANATDARITALADLFPDQLAKAKARFNKLAETKNYSGIEHEFTGPHSCNQMLESKDVDAVVIATPAFYPLEFLRDADRPTPDLPVAACAAMCGCITSILRSPLPNRTHGIPFENA